MISFQVCNDRELFRGAWEFSKRQLRRLIETYPDFYPTYTKQGRWKHSGETWTAWCDGFLPGMLWIVYAREMGDPRARWWRDQAMRYTRPLEPRKYDRDIHDLGLLFMSTYYRWFKLTQDPTIKSVVLEAGRTLAQRFREKGQYLRSFVSEDSVLIDLMANVGIIFYAAIESGDAVLMRIARRHTDTTRRVLVRGDGSTAQEGLFDVQTGEFLRQSTHQGSRGDSCWSRGLAWALYGFGSCYAYARDPFYLSTAEACAGYFIEQTPPDGVPLWDFNAPDNSRELVDTSAAAIAAAGLFRLGVLAVDEMKALLYESVGRRITGTLCREHLAQSDPDWEGILKNGVYHLPKNLGVKESVIWGDYFFLEALDAALGT